MILQLYDCIDSFFFIFISAVIIISYWRCPCHCAIPPPRHFIRFAFQHPHDTHAKGIHIYTHVVPLLRKIICIYTIIRKYLIFYFSSSFSIHSQALLPKPCDIQLPPLVAHRFMSTPMA